MDRQQVPTRRMPYMDTWWQFICHACVIPDVGGSIPDVFNMLTKEEVGCRVFLDKVQLLV
jgi:hypothetical protein